MKKPRYLYCVYDATSAELPLLVTESMQEVADYVGLPIRRVRRYFHPVMIKRRDTSGLFTRQFLIPYTFDKVLLD